MPETTPPVSGVIPCATILLTAVAHNRQDAMTATGVFVTEDPPILSVSIAEHITTHFLIGSSGEFVANIAASDQAELAVRLGSTHGKDVDKIEHFEIPVERAEKVAAPRIKGSYASLDCRVIDTHRVDGFVVYYAEILASSVDTSKVPLVWHQGRFFNVDHAAGGSAGE